MKIIVYAISKNESKFVNRWVKSMSEADEIYVLDTGSTDNTVSLLKENNVIVNTKIYDNFRFDVARNDSLSYVDNNADICVCTDLDEVFNPGWRKELESIFTNDVDRVLYNYNWKLENDKPIISFYIEKIHRRNNYKWIYPVHEVLYTSKKENKIYTDKITLNHYPDDNKSRSSYLPLLELSIKENPNNDRNMHYLGREYMYYKMYDKAIDTLINHINLDNTWNLERCASKRFIGRCYKELNRFDEAIMWYKKSIKECPNIRDSYIELAMLYNYLSMHDEVIEYINKALNINNKPKVYINEIYSFNETPYDLLSISLYYKNRYDEALYYVNKALSINNDERIINNKNLILNKINQSSEN